MALFHNIFEGRRVLVTGHTGFKGSWLSVWLKLLGADVAGYALPPEQSQNHFELLGLEKKIKHHIGDIRDLKLLKSVMAEHQPEIVFHLAAQSLVRKSYESPVETFTTNLAGSVNLLESIRSTSSVKTLVYITTDKCYEDQRWEWGYRESDRLGGHDPYSASKACAELAFSSYEQSYFQFLQLNSASARAGNVIGGGDWSEDRIIPDCIRSFSKGKTVLLRNPSAIRPWQHVLDPLYGYLLLASRLFESDGKNFRGAWNFGPAIEDCRTVKDVAETLQRNWPQAKIEVSKEVDALRKETAILKLNCDKAYAKLNWKPRWNFAQAMQATSDWYRHWAEGRDIWDLTSSQIKVFSDDAVQK
jgi:CDP-glucose 4,6-dehydratase